MEKLSNKLPPNLPHSLSSQNYNSMMEGGYLGPEYDADTNGLMTQSPESAYRQQVAASHEDAILAEAKILRQHKGRLEARMQVLEDHNRQLESQLSRLRQLLETDPISTNGGSLGHSDQSPGRSLSSTAERRQNSQPPMNGIRSRIPNGTDQSVDD